jgi:large subunit ribosomal protein L24
MRKIKKDDQVIVIAGKDKGKRGSIQRVLDEKHVIVAGINMVKKHVKPNPQLNVQGGIVEREARIDVSNVAVFNSKTKKADRVGFKKEQDGKKVRVYKSTGDLIDV